MSTLRKSKRITLGITAAMALTLAGCSDSSGVLARSYDDIEADYIAICKSAENKRVDDDDCKDSTSEHAEWYYIPMYHNNDIRLPKVGDDVENEGVEEIDEDKSYANIGENMDNSEQDIYLQAKDGFGFDDKDNDIDADYVEICVDGDGNRVDPEECGATSAQANGSGGSSGFMFLYLPMFNNASTYVPPVGSQVNTQGTGAISDRSALPSGSRVGTAPAQGLTHAYSSSSNTAKSGGNVGKSSVSRGGFGSSGKAGG